MGTPQIKITDLANEYKHITPANQEGWRIIFNTETCEGCAAELQGANAVNIFLPVGAFEELVSLGVVEKLLPFEECFTSENGDFDGCPECINERDTEEENIDSLLQ